MQMEAYRYPPLDEGAEEIRLVCLHRGKANDETNITLHHSHFPRDESFVPDFEALSYVWGSTDNSETIKIVDLEGDEYAISITRNLADALPHLRSERRDRMLWIDAICINQNDLAERRQQVERMADIYSRATRVVVWLGLEADQSSLAMELMCSLGLSSHDVGNAKVALEDKILSYGCEALHSLHCLLDRPWFQRLWVRQEIRLAEDALLICSSSYVPLESFATSIGVFRANRDYFTKTDVYLWNRIAFIYDLLNTSVEAGLFDLLRHVSRCRCTDPRDKIYGMLSLLSVEESEKLDIHPDYSLSTRQVYQNAVLRYVQTLNSLELLASGEIRDSRMMLEGWPSWVSDWSRESRAAFVDDISLAAAGINAQAEFLGPGILRVKGRSISKITEVERIYQGENTTDDSFERDKKLISSLQSGFSRHDMNSAHVTGGTMLDAVCCGLMGGAFSEDYFPPDHAYFSKREGVCGLSRILDCKNSPIDVLSDPKLQELVTALRYYCRARSIIFTANGYVGLASETAKVGDEVCILLGSSQPLVLRQVRQSALEDGIRYEVVGKCFIEGLMVGEALLGPLPSDYQRVSTLNEDGSRLYHGFLNVKHKEVDSIDPRIYHLLNGEELDQLLVEIEGMSPAEQCSMAASMAMKKRDVSLFYFDLV